MAYAPRTVAAAATVLWALGRREIPKKNHPRRVVARWLGDCVVGGMTPTHRALTTSLIAAAVACGGTSDPSIDDTPGTTADAVTWYRDVLPIVQDNCLGCHSPNGIGPFSMVTDPEDESSYELIREYADAISIEVQVGSMPPWKPSDDCQPYRDTRRLTDSEKATIRDWAERGAKRGDPADAPEALPRPGLPWVSATVDPGFDYLPTTLYGDDDHHCFVLDPALDASEDLIGFQIVPGSSRVHHVLLYRADRSVALGYDASDPGPGYSCFGGPGDSDGVLGGWVPGMPPIEYPAGTGIRLTEDTVILMDVHYNFSPGPPVDDRTSVELMFSEAPVDKPAFFQTVRKGDFAIPPHTAGVRATGSVEAPADGTIWGLAPHMHLLGTRATVTVESSLGSECLVDIPQWDFDWQQFYFFADPNGYPVKRGDRVDLTCEWDNPTHNTVRWGDGTGDEMCIAYMYVTSS